jgi:HAD superfamily hydrolase (TIGR01450 family)
VVAWLLDLDGVVWLDGRAIPGAPEAIGRLRAAGERVLFVTNYSYATVAEQEARLAAIGVHAVGDVVTSAMAAAQLVTPGERVLVAAGPGVAEALEQRGAIVRRHTDGPDGIDAVIVGLHFDFDYERLDVASRAVRAGARLVATNEDPTFPTPKGRQPGAGALVAAVSVAGGAEAVVAGKPHQAMADRVVELVGPGPHVMVGDVPKTDGAFARRLGATFALVLSGVTKAADLPVEPSPDLVGDDLAAVIERLLAQ